MSKPLAFIVEDEEDLALLYEAALRDAGFEVELIPNGARAIGRLAEVKPKLIILDLNLPLVSGENALEQVHSDIARHAEARVIIVTADVKRAELLHDKADLVLIKPVTYSQLKDLSQRMVPSAKNFADEPEPSDADTQRLNPIPRDSTTAQDKNEASDDKEKASDDKASASDDADKPKDAE